MIDHRPNILFVQSDQHRYDCVGFSRDYPVHTPHMDRLAREGAWFSHAYTPIPLCCPARQALLNGRRPEVFGGLWNYDIVWPVKALSPDAYAWPRDLQAAGYRTGYCGKWHVHPDFGPESFGFEQVARDRTYHEEIQRKYGDLPYQSTWFGERGLTELEDSHTHVMADRAIDMIRRFSEEGKPWHIRLDFHAPHLPCRPSEPFASMYDPASIPKWRSFSDDLVDKPYIQRQQLMNWRIEHMRWEDWEPTVAMYYGMISQVDDALGKVLHVLDELGLSDDTIVVYTSDHGDLCGGHRMMDKHYVMYDDVVKVPLIVRWPSDIRSGTTCDAFVYNMLDLPPTLLEAAGLDVPHFFHGRSVWPLLDGKAVPDWRQDVVSTYNGQQFGLYTQRMLRTREWKYVWNLTDMDELYHLGDDPDELSNRIHDPCHRDLLAHLRKQLYDRLMSYEDPILQTEWLAGQLLENRKL